MVEIDFRNRAYLSRYGREIIGLKIYVAGVLTDPDSQQVDVGFFNEAVPPVTIFQRMATRLDVGDYQVTLSGPDLQTVGNYTLVWQYAVAAVQDRYEQYFAIGDVTPPYDNLPTEMKDIVDSVWIRFADCFDSPHGGPNLQTYFQSHYDRGRLAQLLRIAVGRLNTSAQPYMTYTADGIGGAEFPFAMWGALLEMTLYVEALKHLVRSYTEQPNVITGGSITRLDRRDYMDRWRQMLQSEEALLLKEFEVFKIRHMGLGRPRVLVSGGVFGRYGPTRVGYMAARPRYYGRFY